MASEILDQAQVAPGMGQGGTDALLIHCSMRGLDPRHGEDRPTLLQRADVARVRAATRSSSPRADCCSRRAGDAETGSPSPAPDTSGGGAGR